MDERRTGLILLLVLAGHLVLLTSQVRAPEGESTLLGQTALRIVAPVARLVSSTGDFLSQLRTSVEDHATLSEQNRELRGEIDRLRLELTELRGVRREVERLEELVGPIRAAKETMQVADVIYLDRASWQQVMILWAGAGTIEVDQPVRTSDGLVGRVVRKAGRYARVQLITDPSAGVGAMIERTRRQGVLRGTGGGRLQLDYIPLQAVVSVSDRVVTAGIDGVYPRGIPVGRIVKVTPGAELFHEIEVEPAVDFGRLDQVYLQEPVRVPEELVKKDAGGPG